MIRIFLLVFFAGSAFGSGLQNPPTQADIRRAGAVMASSGEASNILLRGSIQINTVTNMTPCILTATNPAYYAWTGTYYYAQTTYSAGGSTDFITPMFTNSGGAILIFNHPTGPFALYGPLEDLQDGDCYMACSGVGGVWDEAGFNVIGTPSVQFADYTINGSKVENSIFFSESSGISLFVINGVLVKAYFF